MTRERRFHRFLPAAAALWLLPALPAVAQDSPLPDLFSEAIDVRVVNVEVVVTDREGNRIRGLTANDFELLVDGEPAPIAYFTEIDEGIVRAAPPTGVEIAEAIPALHTGEEVGTNFLVFIDDFFSIRQHRDGVLRRLEEDLAQLGPADRVAAVASDGANVTLLTGWTNSGDEIRAALRQARERPALGLMRMVDRVPGYPDPQRAIPQSSNKQEIQQAKRYLAEQVKRSALAAVATLRSFAGREGRVTMLVEGALLFGGSPGAELLGVRLGSPERARSRKILVPMEIAIPLDHVQLLPIADRWTNELEFRVTVIDEDGDRSETPIEKILISGPSKPEPGDVFYYETNLLLRRREHRFVAAVYDPLTGAILLADGTVGP